MTNKISMKVLNVFVIFGILLINFFIPSSVFADYEKGDIKDSVISVGEYNDEGDILVTKTIEKTDNEGEYSVTFDIKGKNVNQEVENKKNSYTVFVLDASMSMKGTKWDKAKEAAINFSNTLVNNSNKNYISLVTFNSQGYKLRNFENVVFTNNDFGNINRGTNYNEGLSKAYEYLSDISEDGIKNIVFISDGEPNSDNYSEILKTIKDDNINIFSLAYELDSDSTAYNKLLNISTNNKVYEVSSDDIDEKLLTVANEIIKVNAGSNGIITDNIGDNFNFISGDVIVNGKKVTINIGDITEDNKSYSFIIKIDDDLDTGWYPTNNGYSLNYIDSNNNEKILSTNDSAQVYHISNKVKLTINYYNNDNMFKSVTKDMKKGSSISNDVLDIENNMDNGYYLESVSKNNFNIDDDTIVDVYYKKINNLKYIVNYYKDLELFDSKKYEDVEYGYIPTYDEVDIPGYSICVVNNNTNPIIDNDTIIDVYYCKNDYKYKVKYYYDDVFDSEEEYIAKYNDIIDNYSDKIKEGYVIDRIDNIPLSISDNIDDNIINVYYKLKDVRYTVNYLDKDGNKICKSKEVVGKYNDIVEEKYKEFNDYKLISDEKVSLILDDNTDDIDFIYEIKSGNVIVKYVDEEGNKISDDTIISGKYRDNYSVSIKEIDGYNYLEDNEYIDGVIDEDNKIITLKYKKETIMDVVAPLTGISNKYKFLFIISTIGIICLISIKLFYKLRK